MPRFNKSVLAAGALALVVLGVPAAVACSNGGDLPISSAGVQAAADPAPAKAEGAEMAATKTVATTKTVVKTKTALKTTTVTAEPKTVRVTAAPRTVTVTTTVVAPASTVVQTRVETVVQTETVTVQVEQAAAPQGLADTGSVYFENCSAARAAGAAPVMAGDPGYRTALDRDGDGIGCE